MYSHVVLVCATMHGTGTKVFHTRNTKIKLVAFASVYAVGTLEGKETDHLSDWMKAVDLDKAGVPELGDVTEPGQWLTEFEELENKPDAKQPKLRFF